MIAEMKVPLLYLLPLLATAHPERWYQERAMGLLPELGDAFAMAIYLSMFLIILNTVDYSPFRGACLRQSG